MAHLELVTLIVEEYDAAIDFFVRLLGFDLVVDMPSTTNGGRPKRWVVVRPPAAETGILLARADDDHQLAAAGRQFAGRVGLFLRVDDFDAVYARLMAAGILRQPRKSSAAAPVLGVGRVRQAAEYYRDVLGFSLDPVDGVFQPSPHEPDGVYAIVKRSGAWIHFQIRRGDVPPAPRPAFERDVYLYVDNVDDLHADLVRRGANILSPPSQAPHGIREMVIEDLNGYRLAFGQRD